MIQYLTVPVARRGLRWQTMAEETCPPHHWDIGVANRVETWVCIRCGERKVVDRTALNAERAPFTGGGWRGKGEGLAKPAED